MNYMQRKDVTIFQKVISEIDIGLTILGSATPDEFLQNEVLKRAVGMTVINVGELIKNVSEETKQTHREIPWKAAAGMRDIAAHKYQTLRMEDVYNTLKIDFPVMKQQLQSLLETDQNI